MYVNVIWDYIWFVNSINKMDFEIEFIYVYYLYGLVNLIILRYCGLVWLIYMVRGCILVYVGLDNVKDYRN